MHRIRFFTAYFPLSILYLPYALNVNTQMETVMREREATMHGQVHRHQMYAQIRHMIERDMAEVLAIEERSFENPWTEENFHCCRRQHNCTGMVAEHQERIAGFVIYELLWKRLHVLNFAVAPWARRQGIGCAMVEKLVHKLTQQCRDEIQLEVREGNLSAQQFFRSQGFIATNVLRDYYEDTSEDAYVMRFMIGGSKTLFTPLQLRNRVTQFPDAE